MTSNLPIGMALIGCGNIGTLGHAPAYSSAAGVSLRAVCDLDPSRAEKVSTITGAATRSLEEILANPAIEAVDVAVPTEEHERVSSQALSAGKHVLVEKPITTSLEAAHRLVVQAARENLTLMVGHVRRFDPRYLAVAEELASGSVGTPRYMRRAERQWLPFSGDAWSWSGPGGGVLMDVGVHVADLVRWLLGEPTTVYATTRHVRPEAREWGDHVFVTFGLGESVTAVGEASWAHPRSFATFYGSLEIVGTDGILNLRDAEGPLLIIGPDGVEHPRFGPLLSTIPAAFSAQLEHFASVIAGEIEPHQTASDATRSLQVSLAAAESVETGSPVSLTGSV